MSISGVDVRLILRLSPGPYTLDQDKMVEVSRQPQNLLMIMHLRYVLKTALHTIAYYYYVRVFGGFLELPTPLHKDISIT